MEWTVSLLLFSVINVCFGSPIGLPDVDDDVVEYEDFLKDIVMAAEPRRVRREPMEDVVGSTVIDLLSGRLPDETFDRVRRDEGNQMLIMGSPFARGSPDCDRMEPKDAEVPMEYYQDYSPYQDVPYQEQSVPISMPYPQVPAALPYQQPVPVHDQYVPYITRTLPPRVYKAKTVGATAGIGLPLADGGGAVTHTGNFGGLGLPGLAGLGGGGLAGGGLGGGLGGAGLTGLTAGIGVSAVGHQHGHKGVGSIAVPIGHEPSYITSIPFISGYELKPIYSMKKVVVKEIGKDHGLLDHHKGVGLPGLPGLPSLQGLSGLPGLAARSAEDPSAPLEFYIDGTADHNLNYEVLNPPGLPALATRSAEDSSPPHHFYVDGPGDHHPLDLNIFFVDPSQAKEASEPELMSPEAYSDAIRNLQQRMDHLQSMKLAQEQQTQPDEINCV